MKDSTCFDHLLKPKNRLKLMTICLGPFKDNPVNLGLKLKLRSFTDPKLFKKAKTKHQHYTTKFLYSKTSELYYILVIVNDEIVVSEDICLMFSQGLRFRYWLNAKYMLEGVGKVNVTRIPDKDKVQIDQFMIKDQQSKIDNYQDFIEVISQHPNAHSSSAETDNTVS